MSKTTRRRDARCTLEQLVDLGRHLTRAETAWDDLTPGLKAQNYAPPMATYRAPQEGDDEDAGPRISDPTGEAAIAGTPSTRDETELDRLLDEVAALTNKAHRIVKRWAVDLPLKVEELATLERQADPGCEVVGRITRAGDQPNHWEPEHRTTTLEGLLPRPYRLGRWAYDFARSNGRLPNETEIRRHLDGQRVMASA